MSLDRKEKRPISENADRNVHSFEEAVVNTDSLLVPGNLTTQSQLRKSWHNVQEAQLQPSHHRHHHRSNRDLVVRASIEDQDAVSYTSRRKHKRSHDSPDEKSRSRTESPNSKPRHSHHKSKDSESHNSGTSRRSRERNGHRSRQHREQRDLEEGFELEVVENRNRSRATCVVVAFSTAIIAFAVLLVIVSLYLTPQINEQLRKENEEIYRAMSSGPSTAAPVADGSTVGTANVTGTDHTG